jgi:hypothetical protein
MVVNVENLFCKFIPQESSYRTYLKQDSRYEQAAALQGSWRMTIPYMGRSQFPNFLEISAKSAI